MDKSGGLDNQNFRLHPAARQLPSLPVELWRQIFRLYLRPSITNLPQNSLYGYGQCVSLNSGEVAHIYRKKEQTRAILRCVCRIWKTISDELDDAIVMSNLDEFDWPPGRSKPQAKAIYYISDDLQYYDTRHPLKAYREAKGKIQRTPGKYVLQFGEKGPLAPITIVLLALSLIFGYTASDPEVTRDFTLPQLRYLDITLYNSLFSAGVPAYGTVSSWCFPMLAFLRVDAIGEYAKKEVLGLIRAHSNQLVELHALDLGVEFPTSDDWWSFCSLQLFVMNNLDMLADVLSSVGTLWTRKSTNTSNETMIVETASQRLTMGLQYPMITRHTKVHIIRVFEQSQSVLPFLDFTVSRTWDSIQTTLTESDYHTEARKNLRESLGLMENLRIDFVDPAGNGIDSYEARCLKSTVELMSPEPLQDGFCGESSLY
ncbi:hypothetical protein PIIN_09064 [Serendipita indica DSM 11827]|uniref:Uncharacterized protein n=1 Tax=Serendipita indica (strain DSM 11827) TaxID=1109443 RepID=G4TUT6_SERID|nr:hypothetical protein PIIN_09064 [Serendipita indica DSM 11827]